MGKYLFHAVYYQRGAGYLTRLERLNSAMMFSKTP
jgi:hypothetical protein